jgi:hypothetical protein
MSQIFRSCPDCRAERQFEQCHDAPGGCPDSPDGECCEWFCTECGAAILTSGLPFRAESSPGHSFRSKVA